MPSVFVVVPAGIHDPARPSGGNVYDLRICRGLAASGWAVRELEVTGTWPWPDAAARTRVAHVLAGVPDGAVVLLDGLVASTIPEVLTPERNRLRLVLLVHMPLGTEEAPVEVRGREAVALAAAVAVVTTSAWTRDRLLAEYLLDPERVHVGEPGVDAADLAPGTTDGAALLCVATLTPGKGHDLLVAALARVSDLPWRCVCAGSLERDRGYADSIARQAIDEGIGDRIQFVGPLGRADLELAYGHADVLVLASRAETYGMVVTEALARGLPVITTSVGGLPEALGGLPEALGGLPEALGGSTGNLPGLLVPPDDVAALAGALRRWLTDATLRRRLRRNARQRRETLPGWETTTAQLSRVLAAAERPKPSMVSGAENLPLDRAAGN